MRSARDARAGDVHGARRAARARPRSQARISRRSNRPFAPRRTSSSRPSASRTSRASRSWASPRRTLSSPKTVSRRRSRSSNTRRSRRAQAPVSSSVVLGQTPASVGTPVPPVTQEAVAVPLPGDVRYRGRRLLILYFDLYNMGFFDQMRMYESAAQYIATRMTPADMVAIMVFDNGVVRLKQDFTDDRAALGRGRAAADDRADNTTTATARRSIPAERSARTTTRSICFRRTGSCRRCRRP